MKEIIWRGSLFAVTVRLGCRFPWEPSFLADGVESRLSLYQDIVPSGTLVAVRLSL
jgi:hypothetical protein